MYYPTTLPCGLILVQKSTITKTTILCFLVFVDLEKVSDHILIVSTQSRNIK